MQTSTARKRYDEHESLRPASSPSIKKTRTVKKKRPSLHSRTLNSSKTMPSVVRRGNIVFVMENKSAQYRLPRALIISTLLVFVCAMIIVLTHAQLTNVERQIAITRQQILEVQESTTALSTQIGVRYSLDEIAFIAFTELGMTPPDSSQIVDINVPPLSHVVLGTSDNLLASDSHFWSDMRIFIGGILDRIFGG